MKIINGQSHKDLEKEIKLLEQNMESSNNYKSSTKDFNYINELKIWLYSYRGDYLSFFIRLSVIMAAATSLFIVFFIVAYIIINGIPHLKPSLFELEHNSINYSMLPAIINSFTVVIFTLCLSIVVGICSAIYLVEYAKKGNKIVSLITLVAETLAGIPSIIYGLFGYLAFVLYFGIGTTILAGCLTLAIMILPLIMRTTQEALISVPISYREGGFALGAGKLRVIFCIILPSAYPGILSGIILSIGRIVGESAALILTASTVNQIASLSDAGSTLSVYIYAAANEGQHIQEAFGASVVILLIVVVLNTLSNIIVNKITKK